MQKKEVAVVIPFYKDNLTKLEIIAIEQCFKVLGGYTIIPVMPQSLTLPTRAAKYSFAPALKFDDKYFDGIQGYNELMLSALFYDAFLDYEYILIYQLDAFVFKDELLLWCGKNFDYIGAPWLREFDYPDIVKAVKTKFQKITHTRFNIQVGGLPSPLQFEDKVGNGGLSLRRVSKFYKLCNSMHREIAIYLGRNEHQYNEDAFWSIEVNRKRKILNIPGLKEGLKFAVELFPARAIKINKGDLPFGCHAWDKHLSIWRPILKQYGYNI